MALGHQMTVLDLLIALSQLDPHLPVVVEGTGLAEGAAVPCRRVETVLLAEEGDPGQFHEWYDEEGDVPTFRAIRIS